MDGRLRITDPKIKITGVRIKRSYTLTMKAIAKEKNMPVSVLYNQVVEEYLLNNKPEV